jgi:restriction system protein
MFVREHFPSDDARDEYIATIHQRTQQEVIGRIYRFLLYSVGDQAMQEIRWVIKLLPDRPDLALQALRAFHIAYITSLCTDANFYTMSDIEQLIRAKLIGSPETYDETIKLLFREGPRTFECLVERLYNAMGYETELTSPQNDGGRDVNAWKETPGHRQRLLVECKLHTGRVGVQITRALLGSVSDEKASKGVLVSTAGFTKGSRQLAQKNPRLELIGGPQLILLMNEYLRPRWQLRINSLLSQSEKRSAKK